MLNCLVAWNDAMITQPATVCVERTLTALSDDLLIEHVNGSAALADGFWVLAAADCDEVLSILNAARAQAFLRGSAHAAAVVSFYRALT
jgi:hypothetical protein